MKNILSLKTSVLVALLLFGFALLNETKAQVTVTTSTLHEVLNQYSFTDAITGTANDTTAGINPFTKGPAENVFTVYTYTHQANDSVYIKIYREISGIDGYWTNSTLLGIDSLGGAKVWNDTISSKFKNIRYVLDGNQSTAKKNGVGTTYNVNVLNEREKKIKIE